ncbi:ribonuclease III [Patescibacteria group bacterium]|nr:ribonuclease III [Patescibacteria group bacterium]
MKIEKFAGKINIKFNDIGLLEKALTHRSYVNEHGGSYWDHNERLEYLGDAVLELVVSKHLYNKFPHEKEGILTAYRSALVNTQTISLASQKLGANDYLRLSKGEAKDTGRARDFILADVFEAIIGAVYLDQGYEMAEKFIEKNIFHLTDEVIKQRLWQDSKSYFQEKAQEVVSITPVYKVLEETGPDHDRKFKVGVYLKDELIAEGEGVSKKESEQAAAQKALEIKEWN